MMARQEAKRNEGAKSRQSATGSYAEASLRRPWGHENHAQIIVLTLIANGPRSERGSRPGRSTCEVSPFFPLLHHRCCIFGAYVSLAKASRVRPEPRLTLDEPGHDGEQELADNPTSARR